jgi:hypothetical protein
LFTSPFGFMGALLIEQVDYLTRQIFTLGRLGIIVQDDISASKLMLDVRKAFSIPFRWRHTGVTRQDMLENNQTAELAAQKLTELPKSVVNALLTKTIKFSFNPIAGVSNDNTPLQKAA